MTFRSPGFVPLPPIFFDSSLSDAALQEKWVAGAKEGLRRLKARRQQLQDELRENEEAIADAQQFYDDAVAALRRYRPHPQLETK